MKAVILFILVAAGFWFAMFSPWTAKAVPFWPAMVTAGLVLSAGAFLGEQDKAARREIYRFRGVYIVAAIVSAAGLYVAFGVGHLVAAWLFGFAQEQVASIYAIKAGQSPVVLGLILFFIIGPAEEIFWRGFVQRRLSDRWGTATGFLMATTIYTLVHIWAFNFMLLVAAAICGAFWGMLFARTRNLWVCILSHAIWDVVVFIILPIGIA